MSNDIVWPLNLAPSEVNETIRVIMAWPRISKEEIQPLLDELKAAEKLMGEEPTRDNLDNLKRVLQKLNDLNGGYAARNAKLEGDDAED